MKMSAVPDAVNSASVVAYMSARRLEAVSEEEDVGVAPWCDR